MNKPTVDAKAVRTLAQLLQETDLSEIEYQNETVRIRVVRTVTAVQAALPAVAMPSLPPAPAPALVAAATDHADWDKHPGLVKAQLVGTVYLAPSPDAAAFVKVGDSVQEGQTLLIIEAMKVLNMIKAPKSGILTQFLVQNAQPVEYGDPLCIIE